MSTKTTDTITVTDMEEAIAQREAELIAEHEAFKAHVTDVGLRYHADYGYNGIIPLLKEIGLTLPKRKFRARVVVSHWVNLEAEDSAAASNIIYEAFRGGALGELVPPEGITKHDIRESTLFDVSIYDE